MEQNPFPSQAPSNSQQPLPIPPGLHNHFQAQYQTSSSKPMVIIMLILIVFALMAVSYYLGTMNAKLTSISQKAKNQISQEISSTPAITGSAVPLLSMQTYIGANFSVSYPKDWDSRESYNFPGDFTMFDSTTLTSKQGNGGAITTFPTKFVDIVSVIASSDTPDSYVTKRLSANPAYTPHWKTLPVSVGNYSGVMYQESGEGSQGYDVVLSNGQKIAVINIPEPLVSSDATIKNILSSFKIL